VTYKQRQNEKQQKNTKKDTKMDGYYIGIDPDCEKSGVALLDLETRKLTIQQLPFAEAVEQIRSWHQQLMEEQNHGFKVIIEAGWMNHGNWHLQRWDGRQAAAAKGVSQGRNEQTSRLLGEMMEFYGIPYEFKRPLPKCWSGHDRKITKEELEQVTGQNLGRLNQEGRDAALLAWDKAGFPMRLAPKPVGYAASHTAKMTTSEFRAWRQRQPGKDAAK
jgi:hypothetical protein